MACTNPKPAWKTKNGKIAFEAPKWTRKADYFVPCEKCLACTAQKSQYWAIRMTHEAQTHKLSSFITLTYREEDCPEAISKKEAKAFIRRLRDYYTKDLRYFLCGEYGETTRRPHYHAIIFGTDFRSSRYTYTVNSDLFGNSELDRVWGKGHIGIADFTPATAMYTAGYVNKKLSDRDTFNSMSRFPPLGKRWLERNIDEIMRLDKCEFDGREYPVPPEYYRWAVEEGWITEAQHEAAKERRMQFKARIDWIARKNRAINYTDKVKRKVEKV